jgi:hypothetical protein
MGLLTPVKKYSGEIASITVNVEQPFHFKNLYKFMHDWMVENRFVDLEEGIDKWEKYYLERVGQVKEYIIEWDTIRKVEDNTYYRYKLNIKFHLLNIKQAEVMLEGVKTKLQDGELKVEMEAKIETDVGDKWKKHWLLKYFKNRYDQKIFYQEFRGTHEINLYRLVYELQNLIKDYLKQRCVEPVEGFLHTPRK